MSEKIIMHSFGAVKKTEQPVKKKPATADTGQPAGAQDGFAKEVINHRGLRLAFGVRRATPLWICRREMRPTHLRNPARVVLPLIFRK
jgi:hypothetical protein